MARKAFQVDTSAQRAVTHDSLSALPVADPDGDGIAFNGKPVFSTEEAAAQLNRSGAIWPVKNGVVTFSFAEHKPGGQYNNPHNFADIGADVAGFVPFTADQRDAAREAIQLWDDLVAIKFVEKNGAGADIVYMNTTTGPAQAAAYTPFYNGTHGRYAKLQGDTFVNSDQGDNFDLGYSGYGWSTLVHETGHAIGLSHPGDYNFAVGGSIEYDRDADYFQDSYQYTIMSYFGADVVGSNGYVNWTTGGYYQTPQTPMIHDIAAVQAMYGADTTTRTGDTTYGFNANAGRDVFDFEQNINPFLTIYDAGGHDTLDLSGWTRDSVLDLRQGEFSSGFGEVIDPAALSALFGIDAPLAFWEALYAGELGNNPGFLSDNIGIAFGTVIEDGATGSGDDTLIGNDSANRLDGGAGFDTYTGNGGADTFVIGQAGALDTITDFKSGQDKLDLSALGTNASHVSFAGHDVVIDLDGNGVADLVIHSQADVILGSDILFA